MKPNMSSVGQSATGGIALAETKKIGCIGSGNIVQAILLGAIKSGNVSPSQVRTSAPSDRNFSKIQELGVATTHNNREVTSFSDILFLGCKPYQIEGVAKEISSSIVTAQHLVVSCAAGLPMENLESYFPENTRVIRIIPNLGCSVRKGGVVMVQGTHATREDVDTVRAIFNNVAQCFEVPDRLVESASGILGCGIAFMGLLAEGLSDGGVMVGLQRQDAIQMVAQLFVGAGTLLQETGQHPGQMKDSCCSPNGTSIRGIRALEQGGVRASLMNAVQATVDRAEEIRPK